MAKLKAVRVSTSSDLHNKVSKKWQHIKISSGNIISNDKTFFNKNEIGESKEIIWSGTRKEILDRYLVSIRSVFKLEPSDMIFIKAILTAEYFRTEIDWNLDGVKYVSDKTGVSVNLCRQQMTSLSKYKNLFVKVKKGLYKINRNVLFHELDIQNTSLIQLVSSFQITDAKPSLSDFVKNGGEITEELVDEFLLTSNRIKEMYNKQERDKEKQKKEEQKRIEQAEEQNKVKINPFA